MRERLSIGYLVPGHNLLSTAGPSRNVLSLARALSEHAQVSVAFRSLLEPRDGHPFELLELEPGRARVSSQDDAAIRGIGPGELRAYLRCLRQFVEVHDFDVVLEKSWALSGHLCRLYEARGIPTVLVENLVRVWNRPLASPRDLLAYGRHRALRATVRRNLRRLPRIVAETPELQRALVESFGLEPSAVTVIGLGLDHQLFRPREGAPLRRSLGIEEDATALLYTGVLDRTHDLLPILTALRERVPSIELHVAGDGEARASYEESARACSVPVRFHGRVPHERVPELIAAADLCIAPYDLRAFPSGELGYSTLKIPESMACARPVATVRCARTASLIRHAESGFLLHNTSEEWLRLLRDLPAREQLHGMGRVAAREVEDITWERTAQQYLEVCRRLLRGAPAM